MAAAVTYRPDSLYGIALRATRLFLDQPFRLMTADDIAAELGTDEAPTALVLRDLHAERVLVESSGNADPPAYLLSGNGIQRPETA
jgi:hypothetical protein